MRLTYRNIKAIVLLFLVIIWSGACTNKSKLKYKADSEIMVFAAASLTNVLSEIVDSFEINYNIKVKINLASSGTLARQIKQGAAPDVFLSANVHWVNYIDSLGFVKQNLKQEIAQNSLVLIAPKSSDFKTIVIDSLLDLPSLLKGEYLSMGDPNHVPAGKYAKQALMYFNWYSKIKDRVLPTKDVRTALMVVEMNEAPLGVVFSTDAESSEKVKVIGRFSTVSHKPIKYVAAVCNKKKSALLFYEYLNSEETLAIWTKFGFLK